MDTRTIAWMCLSFLVGGGVVSIIAFVASKFRSLRAELETQVHQLYEELVRRDREADIKEQQILNQIREEVRDLEANITDTQRSVDTRIDEVERNLCQMINEFPSDLDSKMDKHISKHHSVVPTLGKE